MDTGDWITVALTAALVGATAYYAWQNRHMVKEMSATRAVSVMPKLALEWHGVSPTMSFVKLLNVGPGPALDVDIEVVFIPKEDADDSRPADHRRWKASVVASGDQQAFLPKGTNGGIADMEQLGNLYDRVELRGEYKDALGNHHTAEGVLDDISGLREIQRAAHARWQHPEPEQRMAEAFAKKFESPTRDITRALSEIAAFLRRTETHRVGSNKRK